VDSNSNFGDSIIKPHHAGGLMKYITFVLTILPGRVNLQEI
jgi:hypothetical protein